jgi:hypothetical protein
VVIAPDFGQSCRTVKVSIYLPVLDTDMASFSFDGGRLDITAGTPT